MKDNRGFTLVELLAVITLLAIIGAVAFQAIDSVNRANKKKAESAHISNLLASAISYVPTSKIKLPDTEMALGEFGDLPATITSFSGCNRLIIVETIPTSTNICEVRISLEYLMYEGAMDDELKNPASGKTLDMKKSYISIIYVSVDTATGKVNKNTLTSANGKYDGRYYYRLKEVYTGS